MNTFRPIQFGKYFLLDKIAVGGMAELYRAKITGAQGFEKLIAIKKILPHLATDDELVKSFIDEAKLAAFLQHQNIVQIYDFGNMEGAYFIAMEYLFGKDLRNLTSESIQKSLPLSLENALFIAARICDGLDYAHRLKDFNGTPFNIIHRDVSPQNILITYDGQVKLLDFGIAKVAGKNSTTQVGIIKGKVAYMSPEQAGGLEIDHRSDIFSVGILLYEMVTRRRMFEGDTMAVLSKVKNAEFEPPEKVTDALPPKLYDILHHALAKEPDRRYASCGQMLTDLEECIYQLSFRPTARNLSGYMKQVFGEQLAAEESAMRSAAQAEAAGKPSAGDSVPDRAEDSRTVVMETAEKTTVMAPDQLPEKKKRFVILAAVLIVLLVGVFAAVAYILYPKRTPLTPKPSVQRPPAVAAVPPGPEASAPEAALETSGPETGTSAISKSAAPQVEPERDGPARPPQPPAASPTTAPLASNSMAIKKPEPPVRKKAIAPKRPVTAKPKKPRTAPQKKPDPSAVNALMKLKATGPGKTEMVRRPTPPVVSTPSTQPETRVLSKTRKVRGKMLTEEEW